MFAYAFVFRNHASKYKHTETQSTRDPSGGCCKQSLAMMMCSVGAKRAHASVAAPDSRAATVLCAATAATSAAVANAQPPHSSPTPRTERVGGWMGGDALSLTV